MQSPIPMFNAKLVQKKPWKIQKMHQFTKLETYMLQYLSAESKTKKG